MRKATGCMLGAAAAAMIAPAALANIPNHIEIRFDVPIDIPDNQPDGVRIEIEVPNIGPNIIKDLDVGLVIEHTWQGDISVFLTNKTTGIGGFLLNRTGSSMWGGTSDLGYDADNFGNPATNTPLMFDDDVDNSINLYDGPTSGFGTGMDNLLGTFGPSDDGSLDAHDGTLAAGTWSLLIVDHASGDVGSVHHVSLWFELVPAPGALALLGCAGLFAAGRRRRR